MVDTTAAHSCDSVEQHTLGVRTQDSIAKDNNNRVHRAVPSLGRDLSLHVSKRVVD